MLTQREIDEIIFCLKIVLFTSSIAIVAITLAVTI